MSGDSVRSAVQTAHKFDLGIIAAGVLAFLFSFFPYYTVSFGGYGGSATAWHGFFGWFAVLLALVGSALVAAALLGVQLPVPLRLTVAALFGVALLCLIIAGFTWPGSGAASAVGINVGDVTGHGVGYYLSLLVIAAGTALAALRLNAAT